MTVEACRSSASVFYPSPWTVFAPCTAIHLPWSITAGMSDSQGASPAPQFRSVRRKSTPEHDSRTPRPQRHRWLQRRWRMNA